jgi:hypothetical protein
MSQNYDAKSPLKREYLKASELSVAFAKVRAHAYMVFGQNLQLFCWVNCQRWWKAAGDV